MKRELIKAAKRFNERNRKRLVINLIKGFKRDFRKEAKKGKFLVSYRRLDENPESVIALRYIRRHTDINMLFDKNESGNIYTVTVNWMR